MRFALDRAGICTLDRPRPGAKPITGSRELIERMETINARASTLLEQLKALHQECDALVAKLKDIQVELGRVADC